MTVSQEKNSEAFDLSKIFDTVDHLILIQKCLSLGSKSTIIDLLQTFFRNRIHHVPVDNDIVYLKPMKYSAPQNSVLGLTLLLIYVINLSNTRKSSKVTMLVNDTDIYDQIIDIRH